MATSNGSRSKPKELPKECFNRKNLVAAHEKSRHATEQELQRNGKQKSEKPCVGGSAESGRSSPSISLSSQPLSSLKEIFLRQLEIDKRHHGRVLFGTLCVQPFKMSASVIISILADKSGKAASLSILNLPLSLSSQEIEARFPLGRKAAIKEPYLRFCEDGNVLIRVENPADVVLVNDANKEILRIDSGSVDEVLGGVLKELDDIRAEGNKLFAEQKWKEAIGQYRKCIARGSAILEEGEENEQINQRLLLAYSNRSEVWLQQSNYKNALDDANKALEFNPNHLKSLSRRERAWQGFGKVQNPASKSKVPVEETNAADKGLASKVKPTDDTQPATTSSKGKTTSKPNPPSSGVSIGNGKTLKAVSPAPTQANASVDSKNKPAASSATISPPPIPESAFVESKTKPSASSANIKKVVDAESKNILVAENSKPVTPPPTPESVFAESKTKPTASSVTTRIVEDTDSINLVYAENAKPVTPPPTAGSVSVDSKNKPSASSVTRSPAPTPEIASVVSKKKPSASSVTVTKVRDRESIDPIVAENSKPVSPAPIPETASLDSKNKPAASSVTISPAPIPDSASIDSKKKPSVSSVTITKVRDTESKHFVVAENSKPVSPAPTPESASLDSKNKPATSTVTIAKVRDTESRNLVVPDGKSITSTSKKLSSANAAGRPSSNVDQTRANADPPSTAKGTLATSSNLDKAAAADDDSGSQSSGSDSDSDSENDSPTSDSSDVEKRFHAENGIEEYAVIERKPTNANGAWGDSSLPPGFSDSKLTLRSSTEPQKEMAAAVGTSDAAIDTELPSFAPWLDSLRSSADVILSQGNWSDAVKLYNRVTGFALPQRNRDKVIQTLFQAYSHRSEAWIWTGDFEKSLRDADSAIKIADNYPKSVVGYEVKNLLNEVRRGRAFHGLGEYEKACLVFHEALKKFPHDKSISDLLSKSRVALGQSQKGIYDLDGWFVNGCRGPPPPCSDFVGPVEIRRVLGKGRGLFVTKDVEAGDLLLVSNPLLVVRWQLNREDEEDYSHLTTKWRRSRPGADPVGLHDFVNRLARLRTDKEIYQLYSLTGGSPEDEIEVPDMSLFSPGAQLVKPLQGFDSLKISDEESQKLQRISRVAVRNSFEGGLNPLAENNRYDEKDEAIRVGVWALPSFMNHSCVPNCHMIDVGDAMFVRASRSLEQGEELSRAYFDVYQNGIDRSKLCAEWSFVCNCERCILEKSLTDQSILPTKEYRALLGRARGESLKRQFGGREKSLSVLLPNPQPALLQLRKFADWCDGLLAQAEGLGNKEKAWIGASHLDAYISRSQGSRDRNQFILTLENILEFMTNTAILGIGHTTGSALERAALLLVQVEDMYGRGSQTYRRIETRVLDLFHTTFGVLSKEVLFTMSRLIISK